MLFRCSCENQIFQGDNFVIDSSIGRGFGRGTI